MTSESNEPDQKSSNSSDALVAEYQREEIVGDCDLPEIEQNLLTGLTGTGQLLPTTSQSTHQAGM